MPFTVWRCARTQVRYDVRRQSILEFAPPKLLVPLFRSNGGGYRDRKTAMAMVRRDLALLPKNPGL
jgi:hypothetical protein